MHMVAKDGRTVVVLAMVTMHLMNETCKRDFLARLQVTPNASVLPFTKRDG
jgi:hypothetical protein